MSENLVDQKTANVSDDENSRSSVNTYTTSPEPVRLEDVKPRVQYALFRGDDFRTGQFGYDGAIPETLCWNKGLGSSVQKVFDAGYTVHRILTPTEQAERERKLVEEAQTAMTWDNMSSITQEIINAKDTRIAELETENKIMNAKLCDLLQRQINREQWFKSRLDEIESLFETKRQKLQGEYDLLQSQLADAKAKLAEYQSELLAVIKDRDQLRQSTGRYAVVGNWLHKDGKPLTAAQVVEAFGELNRLTTALRQVTQERDALQDYEDKRKQWAHASMQVQGMASCATPRAPIVRDALKGGE